jgi:hypothetical protein
MQIWKFCCSPVVGHFGDGVQRVLDSVVDDGVYGDCYGVFGEGLENVSVQRGENTIIIW